MLQHNPVPLSQPEALAIAEFLDHKGKPLLEKVIRGQVAAYINRAADVTLKTPMDVLAKGPEDPKARQLNIQAAKFQIFLDVLAELSRPDAAFEMARFEVE